MEDQIKELENRIVKLENLLGGLTATPELKNIIKSTIIKKKKGANDSAVTQSILLSGNSQSIDVVNFPDGFLEVEDQYGNRINLWYTNNV